jgi:hypothetical protein
MHEGLVAYGYLERGPKMLEFNGYKTKRKKRGLVPAYNYLLHSI